MKNETAVDRMSQGRMPGPALDAAALSVAAVTATEREAEFISNVLGAYGIPHRRRSQAARTGAAEEIQILVPHDSLSLARRRLRLIPDH